MIGQLYLVFFVKKKNSSHSIKPLARSKINFQYLMMMTRKVDVLLQVNEYSTITLICILLV